MLCVFVHTLEDKFSRVQPSRLSFPKKSVAVWFVVVVLLCYQSVPLLYYLYYSLTIGSWSYVWMKCATIRHVWVQVRTNYHDLFKAVAATVIVLGGLELLVLSFFHRQVLSVMLVLLSLWPYTTELYKRERRLCVMWTVVCLALSVFPILPVVGRNANYYFVVLAGVLTFTSNLIVFRTPRLSYTLFSSFSRFSLPKYLFGVQNVLLLISSFVPALTNWFFAQK